MTIPLQLWLLLPFAVFGLIAGWRRTWREEAITLVGLLITLALFGSLSRAGTVGALVNRIVDAFASFFEALFGVEIQSRPLVSTGNPTTFQIIGFVLAVALAYAIGTALGQRTGVRGLGRFAGSVLGAFNVFLVGTQVISMLNQRRPGILTNEGLITITPDAGVNVLWSFLPAIFVILLVLLLIIFIFRAPKLRQ
jgi:hypothetical protein